MNDLPQYILSSFHRQVEAMTWIFRGSFVKAAHMVVRERGSKYDLLSKVDDESIDMTDGDGKKQLQRLISEKIEELLNTKSWLNPIDKSSVSGHPAFCFHVGLMLLQGKTKYFGSPAIPLFLSRSPIFHSRKSIGTTNLRLFKPMPKEVIAFACTAVTSTLLLIICFLTHSNYSSGLH